MLCFKVLESPGEYVVRDISNEYKHGVGPK